MNLPLLNPVEFVTFVLVLLRVSMILFLAPIFGSEIVPAQIKIALGLTLALMLTGVVSVDVSALPFEAFAFIPIILRELMIGLTLALLIRLILESVQFAGQFIGYQMGFAIVNVVDPQSGGQTSVLSQFAYILALLVFLAANGHHIIITGLVESFELAPIGGPLMPSLVVKEIVAAMGQMFVIAIKIGAPALAVLFCAKVSMGIVSKTVPQMNVLFVGMPLYIMIGLTTFGLSLSLFVPLIGRAIVESKGSVLRVLTSM